MQFAREARAGNHFVCMSLFDTTQLSLEAAMRGSSLRQTLLTDNLANVNTPGYQRKDVDFHATLQAAQQTGETLETLSFDPTVDSARTVRADGSGIDADQESAELAKNALEYQALVSVAGTRTSILQIAMGVR
ncbi:MAG TPA: flagellar basal body rod protein FlgB [Conexibacter sp.]|nr:flagellar basal body rod protein FlgB [Conexibacter sp.]